MTAEATPRPDAIAAADLAYTLAVSLAARTGDWGHARQAREALKQVRAGGGGE